ncbi:MAG: hypothetical protein P8X74_03555 [Reinekea sp.]
MTVNGNDPTGKLSIIQRTGDLTDFVANPYSFGSNSLLAHANTLYYHIHGTPFVYPKYADAVILTSAAGVWATTGSLEEIIPENALNVSAFDLHWISVINISANLQGVIDIYKGLAGVEVKIGEIDIYRNAVQSQEGAKRIQIPQQAKNERISCKFSDNAAGSNTCAVKLNGHYYAG